MSPEIKWFGVRGEILKALKEDPEWRTKLEKAKSVEEFREVINAFVKSKRYKVMDVEEIKSQEETNQM